LACTSFCSPVSPVSVSSQLTCCQLGWKSHPIIIIEGSFLPSVFVLKTKTTWVRIEPSLLSNQLKPDFGLSGDVSTAGQGPPVPLLYFRVVYSDSICTVPHTCCIVAKALQ